MTMNENRSVTDAEIMGGFESLHQAIALGFARVDTEFRAVRGEMNDLRVGLSGFRGEMASLEHRMLRRFDDVDERLTGIDTRLTHVDTRLTHVETRLTKVETRLTKVETRLTKVETRLTNVETRLTKVETRLTRLEAVGA